ncbi:MAG: DUF5684 domain-containing protein [Patescibacteria group bacterium]|nr:hypothetical protein [Patescibacteria group bacterium]
MDYTASYDYSSNLDPEIGAAMGIGFMIFAMLLGLIFYVYSSFCLMKIAQKLNADNVWFAWVPILNIVLMLKLADKPVWWLIFIFIPFLNALLMFIGTIIIWIEIAKKLNKPSWLGALMFISPVNLILLGYLAFSNTAAPAPAAAKK